MNNNFNEFVFIEKKAKNKRRCTKDVYISYQQGTKRLSITFYDGLHQLITSEKNTLPKDGNMQRKALLRSYR